MTLLAASSLSTCQRSGKLPEFAGCLILEWGWGFLAGISVFILALIGALVFLIKRVGTSWRRRLPPSEVVIEKFGVRVTGAAVNIVVVVGAVGAIGYAVYKGYDSFKDSYSVAVDSPTSGFELQSLRDRFQGETQATITINDHAKSFSVTGSYEGACVGDMFDSICRKYAPKLSCSTSWLHRTLVVDQGN